MLRGISLFLGAIARESRRGTTNGTLDTVADTLTQVAKLTLGLTGLATLVLFTATLPQTFIAEQVAGRFLHATHRLVVLALGSVGAISSYTTVRTDREGPNLGGGVGGGMLRIRCGLGLLGVGLKRGETYVSLSN